jgi:hypothetical protein
MKTFLKTSLAALGIVAAGAVHATTFSFNAQFSTQTYPTATPPFEATVADTAPVSGWFDYSGTLATNGVTINAWNLTTGIETPAADGWFGAVQNYSNATPQSAYYLWDGVNDYGPYGTFVFCSTNTDCTDPTFIGQALLVTLTGPLSALFGESYTLEDPNNPGTVCCGAFREGEVPLPETSALILAGLLGVRVMRRRAIEVEHA